MSVNSGLKATKILGQRKAIYRQRIPQFSRARKEIAAIDILSNTYRKDLSWPHFDNKPRVQEKQQLKYQQFQVATGGTSSDVITAFHSSVYGRFTEIQSNLRRKKLHRTN